MQRVKQPQWGRRSTSLPEWKHFIDAGDSPSALKRDADEERDGPQEAAPGGQVDVLSVGVRGGMQPQRCLGLELSPSPSLSLSRQLRDAVRSSSESMCYAHTRTPLQMHGNGGQSGVSYWLLYTNMSCVGQKRHFVTTSRLGLIEMSIFKRTRAH